MPKYIDRYAKYALGILSMLAILAVTSSNRVFAAGQDITISPTSVNQVINPGATASGSFQVFDQGSSGYKYIVYAAPYSVMGENYNPDFTAIPGSTNVTNWIKFSSTGGNIKPGQTQTVNYSISIPKSTLPGGYYAVAFAETQFPKTAQGVTLNVRVGQIFYIQVAGPAVQRGTILTWQSSLFQEPPLTSTLRLQNSGSVHYISTIKVVVSDILGSPRYTLNADKVVLPQTIRRISIPWSSTPNIGLFKVNGTVTYLNQTHKLPTKYVLVMSHTIRIYLLGVVILIVLLVVLRIIIRRLRSRGHATKYRTK